MLYFPKKDFDISYDGCWLNLHGILWFFTLQDGKPQDKITTLVFGKAIKNMKKTPKKTSNL